MHTTLRSLARFASLAAAGTSLLLGSARPAAAEPEFPGVIAAHLGTDCTPQCVLCHTVPEGGARNLKKPSVKMPTGTTGYGLFLANIENVGGDIPNIDGLPAMLDALEKQPCSADTMSPCDSDGDGTSDIDELRAGTDPDQKGGLSSCDQPKYGCGASMLTPLPHTSDATDRAAAALGLLAVGLVFARRLRR